MKINQYSPPTLPPKIDIALYKRCLKKAYAHIEECNRLLNELPSKKCAYILQLREAFFSLYSQGMPIDIKEICLLKAKKRKNIFLKRISNYLKAISSLTPKTRFSIPFWENLHSHLESDFGKINKEIGSIRKMQNWIGPKDCSIEEAYCLPPPPEDVPTLLRKLSTYINRQEDPLLQLGISFGEFLIIHPFMDGNGRCSRVFIAAFLYRKKLIDTPILFLSEYFLTERLDYLKNLHYLTKEKQWDDWLSFYCKGIELEAKFLATRLKKITALYNRVKKMMPLTMNEGEKNKILRFLFQNPVFTADKIPEKVAKILKRKKILAKKESFLIFNPLLKIGQKKSPTSSRA
jgi:Fic family protein